MSHEFNLITNGGHPWTGQPGWDLLEAIADTEAELDKLIQVAEQRYWNVWIRDNTGQKSVVLYKPSGAMRKWECRSSKILGAEIVWH